MIEKPETQVTFLIVSDKSGERRYWDDIKWVENVDDAKVYITADCALTDWSRLYKAEAKILQITNTMQIVRRHAK